MPSTTDPSSTRSTLREGLGEATRILTQPVRRRAALTYLAQRGIDTAAIPTDWPLGYAPSGWSRLSDHLRARGVSGQTLLDTGLARRSSRGTLIDVFRDRVMFPIHDSSGAVAGFIGRDLSGAPDVPKYLNTAETELFAKGAFLYGVHEAALTNPRAIRPVLVEGPLDVLAITARARHTGDGNLLPVAASGTALTTTQAELVADHARRYNVPVVVAMDGDSAGRSAALTAGEGLRHHGAEVRIAVLPYGCDPAEHLANPAATLAVFRQITALPLLTVQLQHAIDAQGDRMQWVEGRLAAARSFAHYLTSYPAEEAIAQTNGVAVALNVAPSTFLGALGTAYTHAHALPPRGTRTGDLLRAAASPGLPPDVVARDTSRWRRCGPQRAEAMSR